MFRIHFDPSISMFVVQMLYFGCIWRTCYLRCEDRDGPHSAKVRQTFNTYEQARAWTQAKGLDKAYHEQQPHSERQLVFGEGIR